MRPCGWDAHRSSRARGRESVECLLLEFSVIINSSGAKEMKRSMCAAAFAVLAFAGTSVFAQADMKPPVAKKEPKVLKIHGYEITDNYAWMRDRNEKKDPEIIK